MKINFELENYSNGEMIVGRGTVNIIGQSPKNAPYVAFKSDEGQSYFIQDKDLERFAVNILKSLQSKRLKSNL